MPLPTGARYVTYNVSIHDESVFVSAAFEVKHFLGDTPGEAETTDAIAQAGADAILSALDAAYGSNQVTASRSYDCYATGDAWPAGAQPLDGA